MLRTIAIASALVTALFGLNVQSAYQFINHFAVADAIYGANQSVGATSEKTFQAQVGLSQANLYDIASNSALVILAFGIKYPLFPFIIHFWAR
jgi:hypothetical protein